MALDVHVLAPSGALPALSWRWDAETDILSGAFDAEIGQAGYTGTVELNDEEGSIAVLDVAGGVLCGLDVVVWPELVILDQLAVPDSVRQGIVVVPSRTARRSGAALEFDTTLSMSTDPGERLFHLLIGTRRQVNPVRVADRLVVEVDAAHRLAGFWLEQVPPQPVAR
jgi:hypothetical protein